MSIITSFNSVLTENNFVFVDPNKSSMLDSVVEFKGGAISLLLKMV